MCDECNEQNRDKNQCDDDDGGRLLFVFIFLMIALNFCGIGIAIRMGCDVSTKASLIDEGTFADTYFRRTIHHRTV